MDELTEEEQKIHDFFRDRKSLTVSEVIQQWIVEGDDCIPGTNMPKHPELIYRRTGEWQGWSDFLGSDLDHSFRDMVETEAFNIIGV